MQSGAFRTDSQGVGEGLGMLQAHAVTLLNMMSLYPHFVVFLFLPFPYFAFLCVFLTFILPDQAILYLSRFVKVETLKEKLLRNNKETYWVPDFVKV